MNGTLWESIMSRRDSPGMAEQLLGCFLIVSLLFQMLSQRGSATAQAKARGQ